MVYVLPIIALLLSFLSFLSSVRFLFSRQGFIWVIPILLSLVLSYENLTKLLYVGEYIESMDTSYTLSSIIPFLISFLWYIAIIVFHFTLKNTTSENKYKNESIKNRNEALYLEKFERRQAKREKKRREESEILPPEKPEIKEFKDRDFE